MNNGESPENPQEEKRRHIIEDLREENDRLRELLGKIAIAWRGSTLSEMIELMRQAERLSKKD